MKKLTIIAAVLIVLGAVLFLVGFALSGFDVTAMDMETAHFKIGIGGGASGENHEYTYSPEDVTALVLTDIDRDVILAPSEDGLIHVICYESGSDRYAISAGSTLTVTRKDTATIRFFWFSGWNNEPLRVLIPESMTPDVTIETVSGDIELDVIKLGKTELSSTSGDIDARTLTASSLSCSTVSGEIDLGRVEADRVEAESTSGDVSFDLLSVESSIHISTVSGEIRGTLAGNREAYATDVSTVSGGSSLPKGRSGSGSISAEFSTVSGDIEIVFGK